jgi:hypothetical protein
VRVIIDIKSGMLSEFHQCNHRNPEIDNDSMLVKHKIQQNKIRDNTDTLLRDVSLLNVMLYYIETRSKVMGGIGHN